MTIKEGQHLHNALGNVIGEAKRRLYQRIKDGSDIEDAVACFIAEIRLAFDEIKTALKT